MRDRSMPVPGSVIHGRPPLPAPRSSAAASGRAQARAAAAMARHATSSPSRPSTSATRRAPSSSASGTRMAAPASTRWRALPRLLVGGDVTATAPAPTAGPPPRARSTCSTRTGTRPGRRPRAPAACRPRRPPARYSTRTELRGEGSRDDVPVARARPRGGSTRSPPIPPCRQGVEHRRLMRRAPSEPPNDEHEPPARSRPRRRARAAARSRAGSMATISARMGFPVTTARGNGVPSKLTALARREAGQEAVGRTWRGVLLGHDDRNPPHAPRPGPTATLAYPPTAITTDGRSRPTRRDGPRRGHEEAPERRDVVRA